MTGRHRRRRRHRLLGRRQAEHRGRRGRGRASRRQRSRDVGQPEGAVHTGLLPRSEGAGRGDRRRRRRRAAPHRRAGSADARRQGDHGEVTKRGGANQDRRHPQRGGGGRAPGHRCRKPRHQRQRHRAWPRCWKPPRRSARSRRSPTPCGSGSGGPRRRCSRGRRSTSRSLDRDQLNDIALYLNFDMLGSPNAGFFTYDGDQSGQPNPDVPASTVPDRFGRHRTHAGRLPEPGRDPPRRHAAGQGQRLQPVSRRRCPDRWHDHRCGAAEIGAAGAAVGWHSRASRSTGTITCRATRSTMSTAMRSA